MHYSHTILTSATLLTISVLPHFATAQSNTTTISDPIPNTLNNLLNLYSEPIISFLIGLALLVFVWGMFKYFILGINSNGEKEAGQSLLMYATLGLIIIVILWTIVSHYTNSQDGRQNNQPDTTPTNIPLELIPTRT